MTDMLCLVFIVINWLVIGVFLSFLALLPTAKFLYLIGECNFLPAGPLFDLIGESLYGTSSVRPAC